VDHEARRHRRTGRAHPDLHHQGRDRDPVPADQEPDGGPDLPRAGRRRRGPPELHQGHDLLDLGHRRLLGAGRRRDRLQAQWHPHRHPALPPLGREVQRHRRGLPTVPERQDPLVLWHRGLRIDRGPREGLRRGGQREGRPGLPHRRPPEQRERRVLPVLPEGAHPLGLRPRRPPDHRRHQRRLLAGRQRAGGAGLPHLRGGLRRPGRHLPVLPEGADRLERRRRGARPQGLDRCPARTLRRHGRRPGLSHDRRGVHRDGRGLPGLPEGPDLLEPQHLLPGDQGLDRQRLRIARGHEEPPGLPPDG
jgi:hypothetical protein